MSLKSTSLLLRVLGPISLAAMLTPATAADSTAVVLDHARPAPERRIADCVNEITRTPASSQSRCPRFLVQAIVDAAQSCADAGGSLEPTQDPTVWRLDVDGDGHDEFAFQTGGIVACSGAWSLFSCGSLGCPLTLLQEHSGGWRSIGQIYADAPQSIDVLGSASGGRYGVLRVGCGNSPCVEHRYYRWLGQAYEIDYLDVRGVHVAVTDSIHGLYRLARATELLTTPTLDADVIARYGPETEVAIIGTTTSRSHYYVSPCNACTSGFVPVAAVEIDRGSNR